MENVLIIYYFKDLNDKTQRQNFEFFTSYGLFLSSFNVKLLIIVNKLEAFNTIYKLPDIDILEYPLYDNVSIIRQIIFEKYVHNLFEYVCYIDSLLIGPIVDTYEQNWLYKLVPKLDNVYAKKHFSGSFILFHKTYFINTFNIKKKHIKEIPNLDIFLFRKNLLPYDYNDEIYDKFINFHFQSAYNTKEKRIFHYLKLLDVISFDKIKQKICEYELEKVKEINIEEINIEELYTEIISKETFRLACLEQLPIIQDIEIPDIVQNNLCETVLVEFRWFEHLEFLVRNMVLKLPLWSHTIVCGNINYDYIKIMCDNIHKDIKIVKLNIDNLSPSDYSNLLISRNFWDNFYGEKILIYQEDSFLFHSENIDVFLEYDYVGAPWKTEQDDNSYGVGNGGFSLRSKSKMIEVIEKIKPEKLFIGEFTKAYMNYTDSYILPEDVYFSKSLIDYNIGKVATREIASKFSQECLKSDNPIGGHNFYLAGEHKNIGMIKTTNKIGVYTPYPFNLGGGEKYLCELMKFFINKNYNIYFFTNTNNEIVKNTFSIYNIDYDNIKINKVSSIHNYQRAETYFDYFIEMSNNMSPLFNFKPENGNAKIAHQCIFHCQFPENYNENDIENEPNYIDKVIVNSEYTYSYLKKKYGNKLNILYPLCDICDNFNISMEKPPNTFITIGRLFPYFINNNCKNIDKIINVFKQLDQFEYTLHIVCSIKDVVFYENIKSQITSQIQSNKIIFYPDCSNEIKQLLLSSSKYCIHATGITNMKNECPSSEEHFGISPIEGISYRCIPIFADRGYPPYYVENNKNGYLFNNEVELYDIIYKILNQTHSSLIENVEEYNLKISEKFTNKKKYEETLTKILFNI